MSGRHKNNICFLVSGGIYLYCWKDIVYCIVFKHLRAHWWQTVHKFWTINDDDICLRFCVWDCNKRLENGSELWFLTAVELSTLTQSNWKLLVLMLKEFLQITFLLRQEMNNESCRKKWIRFFWIDRWKVNSSSSKCFMNSWNRSLPFS